MKKLMPLVLLGILALTASARAHGHQREVRDCRHDRGGRSYGHETWRRVAWQPAARGSWRESGVRCEKRPAVVVRPTFEVSIRF